MINLSSSSSSSSSHFPLHNHNRKFFFFCLRLLLLSETFKKHYERECSLYWESLESESKWKSWWVKNVSERGSERVWMYELPRRGENEVYRFCAFLGAHTRASEKKRKNWEKIFTASRVFDIIFCSDLITSSGKLGIKYHLLCVFT